MAGSPRAATARSSTRRAECRPVPSGLQPVNSPTTIPRTRFSRPGRHDLPEQPVQSIGLLPDILDAEDRVAKIRSKGRPRQAGQDGEIADRQSPLGYSRHQRAGAAERQRPRRRALTEQRLEPAQVGCRQPRQLNDDRAVDGHETAGSGQLDQQRCGVGETDHELRVPPQARQVEERKEPRRPVAAADTPHRPGVLLHATPRATARRAADRPRPENRRAQMRPGRPPGPARGFRAPVVRPGTGRDRTGWPARSSGPGPRVSADLVSTA